MSIPPRRILFPLAALALLLLAGCAATLRPIGSKPPVAHLVLAAPFDFRGWHGMLPPVPYHVLLPAGEYRPLYEDDQSYYYQAPSKVVVNDPSSFLYDGGIYVTRGTTTPAGWYYIGEDGSQTLGAFTTPPPIR